MSGRKGSILVLVLVLFVTLVARALAGGWVAVSLDELPRQVRAGETLHLGFTLLQHGFRPVDNAEPALFADNVKTGESLQADARREGAIGHYVLDVTFPSAGEWAWGVAPKPWPIVDLEPLTVLSARTAIPEPLLSGDGLGGLWWPVQLILRIVKDAPSAAEPTAVENAADPDYGRALFVAKGCHACHIHSAVSNSVSGPVIGPNLSSYHPDPGFVRRWLRNPAALRPNTEMPKLVLSEGEIDALVAFLNAGADQ
jgi:cytochrome c2